MKSAWKRIGCSVLSVLICAIVFGVMVGIRSAYLDHNVSLFLQIATMFAVATLFFASAGWLISLPLVLLIRDIRGRRFWVFWAAGTAIGPTVYLGLILYALATRVGDLWTFTGGVSMLVFCTVFACSSCLLYLMLVRRAKAFK